MYDYLVVGAGMFGATFARLMCDAGRSCLVVDKREHVAGHCYTEAVDGIQVHCYGPHIFHTSDEETWQFVNRFASFNNFVNSPLAIYRGRLFSLPFNMYTFHQMWGVITPKEARAKIEEQRLAIDAPSNLEEQALSLVGRDIYETLIKGYTEKQWLRPATELPASIIRRLPVRFTYNNNYFDDRYQGIPIGGYTALFEKMLDCCEVRLGVDFFANRAELSRQGRTIVFTGCIDEFYDYQFGALDYRTLRFETESLATDNFQGNAVVNYTERRVPYTRIVEHKHFDNDGRTPGTVITREFPDKWSHDKDPYYPIRDEGNSVRYERYADRAATESNVIFGGRLAQYQYRDMHQIIASARTLAREEQVRNESS